jgi:hypothetical protein
MGCTLVMKLSEKTPLSGLMMCHLFKEAGIPAGVINVVNGYGDPTGELICRHMDIKKIAFTGSSAVCVSTPRDFFSMCADTSSRPVWKLRIRSSVLFRMHGGWCAPSSHTGATRSCACPASPT